MKRVFLIALLMLSMLLISCSKKVEPAKPPMPVPNIQAELDEPEEESDIIITENIFSEKTDFSDEIAAEVYISAPKAEAPLYGENVDKFNQIIEMSADTVKNEYYYDVSIGENAEGVAATSRTMSYDVYTAKDGYISVILYVTYDIAGFAHPNSMYRCVNYDLTKGESLTLADVVGEDKIEVVKSLVLDQMRAEPQKYFSTEDDALSYIDINHTFLEKDGNIYIVIGEYEIAPRSEGIQIFEISKGEIG